MLGIAGLLSMRAACQSRHVGCVLTDFRNRILATGYNGRARGLPNCTEENPCPRQQGTGLLSEHLVKRECEGVHAEINALLQCRGDDVRTAYVTCVPCWHCTKALINTACDTIVTQKISFLDEDQRRGMRLWAEAGRKLREVT